MQHKRFHLLVSLFTRRFFENDLLAPDIDLRPSAIWLFCALGTPSILWTVKGIVRFGLMTPFGYEVIEFASWFDKSLLLMLAMVSAGVVTVLSWEALLIDRRDAMILGSIPLASRVVVGAKAMALVRLFIAVMAINLPGMLIFIVSVYSHFEPGLAARALVAHAIAVGAASLSTCLVLTAALVTVTSLFEGRWLRVMTVMVQVLVLLAITGLLMGIQWSHTVMVAARTGDVAQLSWTALWPPAWFLGLYQSLLGVSLGQDVFRSLSRPALVMIVVAFGLCVPLTLLLWHRALRVLVAASAAEAPGGGRSTMRRLPRVLARAPLDRALIQFALTVLWRSPRHRLAVLTAAGLAVAVTLEGAMVLASRPEYAAERWLTEFALPVLVLLVLLTIFRWLLTLPAELPASWVLGLVMPTAGATVRSAVGRVFLVLVVLPASALALMLSWWQGDVVSAMAHALLVFVGGLALIERALARLTFMPFVTEYLAGRSNLKARWPIHVVVLLFVVPTLAQIERALLVAPGAPFGVAVGVTLVTLAWARHRRHARGDLLTADPGTGTDWTPVELRIGWT